MSITIASNITAIKLSRSLAKTTTQLQGNYARLSSGLRVNKASDDPAGLSLSESLRANTRIASVAIRNASDGLSLISVNDAALGEIVNTLSRMAELAEQAANGVITNTQRSSLQTEFVALGSEIQRIATVTNFNSINLLSAGGNVVFQVGFNSFSNSRIQIGQIQANLAALSLASLGSAALSFSVIANSESNSTQAAVTALAAVRLAIDNATAQRGLLGAYESRLSVAVSNLEVVRENFIAAGSRIRDVDVAKEVSEMIKNQILQQATTALLAQANVQPKIALRLLAAE